MWWTSLWSRFIIFKPCPPVTSGFLHLCLSLTPLFTVFSLFSPLPPPLLLLLLPAMEVSFWQGMCRCCVTLFLFLARFSSLFVTSVSSSNVFICVWPVNNLRSHPCYHFESNTDVFHRWSTAVSPLKGHYTQRESLRNCDAKDRVAECSSDGCHYGWFVPWCKDYTYICICDLEIHAISLLQITCYEIMPSASTQKS